MECRECSWEAGTVARVIKNSLTSPGQYLALCAINGKATRVKEIGIEEMFCLAFLLLFVERYVVVCAIAISPAKKKTNSWTPR